VGHGPRVFARRGLIYLDRPRRRAFGCAVLVALLGCGTATDRFAVEPAKPRTPRSEATLEKDMIDGLRELAKAEAKSAVSGDEHAATLIRLANALCDRALRRWQKAVAIDPRVNALPRAEDLVQHVEGSDEAVPPDPPPEPTPSRGAAALNAVDARARVLVDEHDHLLVEAKDYLMEAEHAATSERARRRARAALLDILIELGQDFAARSVASRTIGEAPRSREAVAAWLGIATAAYGAGNTSLGDRASTRAIETAHEIGAMESACPRAAALRRANDRPEIAGCAK
jgi:hypothetical protein